GLLRDRFRLRAGTCGPRTETGHRGSRIGSGGPGLRRRRRIFRVRSLARLPGSDWEAGPGGVCPGGPVSVPERQGGVELESHSSVGGVETYDLEGTEEDEELIDQVGLRGRHEAQQSDLDLADQ